MSGPDPVSNYNGEIWLQTNWISNSCSSKRKTDFGNLFSGSEYFAQRLNWFFDENVQKSYLGPFLATWVTFFALFGSYGGDLGGTFGSNVPLALLIDQ